MSSKREQLGTIVDAHSLRFERVLPGPKMRVWDFLTKRELLRLWLAEGAITEKVGSSLVLDFDEEEVPQRQQHGAIILGTVLRCELGTVLSYSWSDNKTESLVTFELETVGNKVLLVVTHRDLPQALLSLCGAGWHTHLEILKARLDGLQPEPFLKVFESALPAYEEKMAEMSLVSGNN